MWCKVFWDARENEYMPFVFERGRRFPPAKTPFCSSSAGRILLPLFPIWQICKMCHAECGVHFQKWYLLLPLMWCPSLCWRLRVCYCSLTLVPQSADIEGGQNLLLWAESLWNTSRELKLSVDLQTTCQLFSVLNATLLLLNRFPFLC